MVEGKRHALTEEQLRRAKLQAAMLVEEGVSARQAYAKACAMAARGHLDGDGRYVKRKAASFARGG